MTLPHAILQTTFSGSQSICEYQGNFQSTMSSFGLDTDHIPHGEQFTITDTSLYSQSDCCSGSCCTCTHSCGGQLASSVLAVTTSDNDITQTMLDRLALDGNGKSADDPCNCSCPDICSDPDGNPFICPGQPPPGSSIPRNGWVGIVFGPFTDSSGVNSTHSNDVEPFIQYQITEQPITGCSAGVEAVALNIIEDAALGMLTGNPEEAILPIIKDIGTAVANLALQCAGAAT
jgi:hypothetical protein